jgi:uncharacterized protein YhdP
MQPLAAQGKRAALPGFSNLSGSIDASDEGGSVNVDASRWRWHAGLVRRTGHGLRPVGVRARWSWPQADQLLVEVDNLNFSQGALNGTTVGPPPAAAETRPRPGQRRHHATVDNFDIASIGRWLPLATHEHLRDWLVGALQGGTLHDARLRLRGDLAHFPFRPRTRRNARAANSASPAASRTASWNTRRATWPPTASRRCGRWPKTSTVPSCSTARAWKSMPTPRAPRAWRCPMCAP